jgi:prevent-host-death family protein
MKINTLAKTKKKSEWQLQEAKAMFSEVIKAAFSKPQVITVRGKETAVLLSYNEYQKLIRPRQTLFEFIQNSPLRDFELELPARESEKMREVLL